jgi:hypothetical protein
MVHYISAHPDPTIHPVMLREFAKKLKKNYGWTEADFIFAQPSENETTGMKSLKWDTFLTAGL